MACATFGLRCSIASAYPPAPSSTNHPVQGPTQGSLLGSGTPTRRYTLKLSRDLTISGECQSVQVSPRDPAPLLTPLVPIRYLQITRQFESASSAYVPSPGCAVRIPNAPWYGFAPLRIEQGWASRLAARVRVAQLHCSKHGRSLLGDQSRLGIESKGACLPPALITAAPTRVTRYAAGAD